MIQLLLLDGICVPVLVDIDFFFFGCQVLLASNIRKVWKVQVLTTPKCLWKVMELGAPETFVV